MKRFAMILAAALLLPSLAIGAEIVSGTLDEASGEITLGVVYSGGCKTHDFELEMQICRETFPVQCEARLVDKTMDDLCEARVGVEVKFSLKGEGLTDPYYAGGTLRISGDNGTSVTVTLPK